MTVDKDNTTIVDGAGSHKNIEGRIKQLRTQIDETTSDYDREKLQERLAKLAGGVASFIFDQQWPFTAGQRGTVFFEPVDTSGTASGLAILGLRFTPDNAYTSVTSLQVNTLDY